MPIIVDLDAEFSRQPSIGQASYGAVIQDIAADGAWLESLKILTIVNGAAPIAQRSVANAPTYVSVPDSSRLPVVSEPSVLITDQGELARRLEMWEAAGVSLSPNQPSSSVGDVHQSIGWFQRWRKTQAKRAAEKQLRRACRSAGSAWLATDENLIEDRQPR